MSYNAKLSTKSTLSLLTFLTLIAGQFINIFGPYSDEWLYTHRCIYNKNNGIKQNKAYFALIKNISYLPNIL